MRISHRLPTARGYLRAFGGWVLAPTDDVPARITGWSGNVPSHLRLSFDVQNGKPWLEVDHRADGRAFSPMVIAADLAWRALLVGKARRFPIELRFERQALLIPLDGRQRRFTMITCGNLGTAIATLNGCVVSVSAIRSVLESLSLRTVGEQELRRLVNEHSDEHNRHRVK